MTDVYDRQTRSRVMSSIRSQGNATTELRMVHIFRSWHITGWRRNSRLRGKPDFVFQEPRVAVFVDGCFWHGCSCRSVPATNTRFWKLKIAGNRDRDRAVNLSLKAMRWKVVRFWEHELKDETRVAGCLRGILARGGA
jgi:DNA mismatch endonuclease (patch repair protein)